MLLLDLVAENCSTFVPFPILHNWRAGKVQRGLFCLPQLINGRIIHVCVCTEALNVKLGSFKPLYCTSCSSAVLYLITPSCDSFGLATLFDLFGRGAINFHPHLLISLFRRLNFRAKPQHKAELSVCLQTSCCIS